MKNDIPPPPAPDPILYVIGDVHGQRNELLSLLLDAGIVDDNLGWAAGDARVWFVGDYADRGPDGIGTIDLVMRLERLAAQAGGQVGALLGNHDLLLLMAHRFGEHTISEVTGLTFLGEWLAGGGQRADLAGLSAERAAWLAHLPAMALVSDRLIVHGDSLWYTEYGQTIEEVNAVVRAILSSDDPVEWDRLLGAMSTRLAFDETRGGSVYAARMLLDIYGGRQVVHGHTPIPLMRDVPVEKVEEALVYSGGLAVNVDGAMYLGGPGVILTICGDVPLPPADRA